MIRDPAGLEGIIMTTGALAGIRVLEFSGLGPAPFCAMMLSDMGADVVRIERPGGPTHGTPNDGLGRGRGSIEIDIRSEEGRATCLAAIERADVLIEGFRPGVMERLGLGPEAAAARNPRLVYGRVTGWGREGPLAQAAGHDINYVALTGALAAMGTPGDPPRPALNLVGDYGGGGMFLLAGILAALFERERSGKGQVVDAAIIDGTALLMANMAGLWSSDRHALDRDRQPLAGAAPYYRCYTCADGKAVAVGALEPQFRALLLATLGLPEDSLSCAPEDWPVQAETLATLFGQRTQAQWCALLEGTDACFAPVLTLEEAAAHPHVVARGICLPTADGVEPAPAPRFSRTPSARQGPAPVLGRGGRDRLALWNVTL